ncbi:hypothetical protein ABZ611_13575 [Streptomyces sp. NPDC007861]|uniref:hypothetical protein n=1 Tax=Streptomyces sp. NPDC007861 TaxID=3154893 RepID=UPI00340D0E3B
MGTKKFSDAGRSGLTDVVKQLQSDHAERLRWSQGKKICEISPGNGASTIKVTFSLYASDDLPGDGHSASLHAYSMGKGALSGAEDAELYFECTSPELKGSAERPARILGHLSYWKAPEDTRATHDANLTVLHSISLAVAKELKCENNADLPSEPKLTPKD